MEKNKKTILIVEDDRSMASILKDEFEAADFSVLVAKNGSEGLRTALERHPDLIILDILMPVMNGVEMLKKMRQDQWGENAPVVVLTNASDVKLISETIGENVYDYLVKSDWDVPKIVAHVKQRLGA